MKLSGIKLNKSIVFEDSIPGLKSSLAAKLPTIYVPSNIPAVIEKDMNLDCYVDSLGNENCKANVIKGPELNNNFVDFAYLEKYLMTF
jgi:beta-phosphoglucomutase-like phosphatase (HAD superfamily)